MGAADSALAGQELLARAAELARFSDSPSHYTRTFLTPAHRQAATRIAEWMHEASRSAPTGSET